MDEKLSELKEKQDEISDKIQLLQMTNKKKEEEADKIRQLIAECRENINRIKSISESEVILTPCPEMDDTNAQSQRDSIKGRGNTISGQVSSNNEERKSPCETKLMNMEKKPCLEKKTKPPCTPSPVKSKGTKKSKEKERVSCRVDLNTMKVRIRGPSEDLKKLDATQLINLLEKFQCQELIINTGEEMIRDPGEIRLFYLLHPGHIILAAAIIFIAFLINTNLCSVKRTPRTKFLLNILFLSSFAFHYGIVLWTSFLRGYALKYGLSQDMFHLVDSIILLKYYCVCVLLSVLSLFSFLATHCVAPCTSWPLEVVAQMIVIVITFFMELIMVCYVVPALMKLRDATDIMVPDDDESESYVPCSYEKNLIKLGKLNWTICLINFLTLVLLGANIYYITSKLNIGNNN